jgi:hypothetical protein
VLARQAEDRRRAEAVEGLHDEVAAVAPRGRVQGRLRLRVGGPQDYVVVVRHLAALLSVIWRASAIWRDMIVVSSYAVCEAATAVISAWS